MARDPDAIIQEIFAASGDVGLGDLIIDEGWPIAYSTPGGKDPQRLQFNQLYKNLFALAKEINQKGPFLEYTAIIDYAVNAGVIGSDGALYRAIAANGPGTIVVDPVGNPATWKNITPTTWVVKSGAYTAKPSDGVFVDTSGGVVTITLPLSPSIGDRVLISDFTRSFSANNCTLGRNGEKINGVAADLVLVNNGFGAEFVFANTAEGWIAVNEVSSGGPLSNTFVSAPQVIASAAGYILPHGLPSTPYLTSIVLRCLTDEHNYSIGDEVIFNPYSSINAGSAVVGAMIQVDATNLTVRVSSAVFPFSVFDKTTGVIANATNANWEVIIRAWV